MGFFTFEEIRTACGGEFNTNTPDLSSSVENIVSDSRQETFRGLFIALEGERFDGHDFLETALQNGAVLLLVNRKKKERIPEGAAALLVEDTLKAYQDLALFHRKRFPDLKLIALTGSYGKTSTKEILKSIFVQAAGEKHVLATEGNFNNQIGVPKTLLNLTKDHRYAIVEMGTNHFGEIAPLVRCARPQASMIVSIGNCHLEFLRDPDGVAEEKSEIFKVQSVQTAVFPLETPQRGILERAALHISNIATFGKSPRATVRAVYHGGTLDGSKFELIHTPGGKRIMVEWALSGEHQAVNCAGAAALALEMGIDLETIGEGVRHVTLPGNRMRRTRHGESFWINDAYNANPDSMCASLAALAEFADPASTLLVLGDMGELGKNSLDGHLKVLSCAAALFPESRIVAIGPKMAQAVLVLETAGKGERNGEKRFLLAGSAEESIPYVRSLVRKGDLVFLKGSNAMKLFLLEPPDEDGKKV